MYTSQMYTFLQVNKCASPEDQVFPFVGHIFPEIAPFLKNKLQISPN